MYRLHNFLFTILNNVYLNFPLMNQLVHIVNSVHKASTKREKSTTRKTQY